MSFDSSQFDVRLMNSGAVSVVTPNELTKGLLPFIEQIIMDMPEDDTAIENRLRAIVNILVISKLNADRDRSELEKAKSLITNGHDYILKAQPTTIGGLTVLNLSSWTIINLVRDSVTESNTLCNNLSEVIDTIGPTQHYILDLSNLDNLDLPLAGYLIGLQKMLAKWGRKMSLVWLNRSSVSPAVMGTLVSRFKLYQKGTFFLSQGMDA